MVLIDCVTRLIPDVLGSAESIMDESHSDGLLEYPQYTRPAVYDGDEVPEVLLSGNHRKIDEWRRQQSLKNTLKKRPDLLKRVKLTEDDLRMLIELEDSN